MSTAVLAPAKVPNYVNGEWVDSTASEWLNVVNPATGDAIASVPLAGSAEVAAVVEAAAAAFPGWRRTPPTARTRSAEPTKLLLSFAPPASLRRVIRTDSRTQHGSWLLLPS